MKLTEKVLASGLALVFVVAALAKTQRLVPAHPSRKPAAPVLDGRNPADITRLVDKVATELQKEKEAKAKETEKRDPYAGISAVAPSASSGKVAVPRRVLEQWASDKNAGVLFGAHAFAGPGLPFGELQRQQRLRCAETPGLNYWSCRPEGSGKYFCVDCYEVQVRANFVDLGTRRWEPQAVASTLEKRPASAKAN